MDMATVDAAIEAAFARVECDEECTLHQAQLLDQTMDRKISEEEWREAKDRDEATDWLNVPDADLDECDTALSHSTPQCWRFYLPAYMRRAMRLLGASILETWFPGSVVFHLSYPSKSIEGHVLDRFKLLDGSKRQWAHFLSMYETIQLRGPRTVERQNLPSANTGDWRNRTDLQDGRSFFHEFLRR
jgi:hypothetical protein